ncbi:radical SAM/SPASM domain-containing protein [Petrocella sp. FN5]|uniref:radical SAM/SPASM domain-containing protein n=1 Tax=Petrocella sp. FN5 TaxID=3032002 RepID=UPI0023DBA3FB|nr:radical SAM/SPASM domain-containing protein [Petrocella sp. FN5]MDF1617992.1 radical SAM/SPASM domain-containing protein [Petrocella sp. FN5]
MKTFKRIYIEITNTCNLSCSFCPPSERTPRTMIPSEFEAILNKLKGYGKYIYLHIKGEPLLHDQIALLLEMSHNHGFQVNLTTNGTLLQRQKEILLRAKALRQISISLQSFETIGNNEAHQAYLESVTDFVEEGLRISPIIFELRLWNLDLSQLGSPAYEKNQKVLGHIKTAFDLQEELTEGLPEGKGLKLKERLYLSQSYVFKWPGLEGEILHETGTCYGLRQQIGILANGDVVPCCLDAEGAVVLGNIFTETMEEILDKKRTKTMIQGFETSQLTEALCQRCGYRERF